LISSAGYRSLSQIVIMVECGAQIEKGDITGENLEPPRDGLALNSQIKDADRRETFYFHFHGPMKLRQKIENLW